MGVVTFAAGTDGNIVLGDNASDNIVFNADVNSNIIPNTDNAYDLGSSGQEWRDLYLDGVAYIDTLQVHETSVFTGNIDANGNLDVDGHTELDDVNVAGVSTFVGAIDANGGATIDNIQIGITDNNEIDTAAGNLTIDSAGGTTTIDDNVAVTGTFSVSGSTVNIDSADINLGNATSDIITATGRFDSDLVPSTDNARDLGLTSRRWRNIYVNTLDISGDIDVDGQTELDDLNVAGVSTFVGAIDANGNLGIDGQTDLDVLNVAETATFASNIDANGNLDVDGQTDLGVLNVAETTFASNIDANGNLDVDGQTDLDVLNVAETATFSSDVTFTGANYNVTWDSSDDALEFPDNAKLKFGSAVDLQIFHDGSNSYIQESGTGDLRIRASKTLIQPANGSSTTLEVDSDNNTFAIGSASNTVTATMNGGAIPSIGLVIALGG